MVSVLEVFSTMSLSTLILSVVLLLVFIVAVIFVFYMYNFVIYNRVVNVFENIGGRGYQPVFKDKARLIKIGDGGEELLYLRKKKVYRTAYGKKMGKNTYWFAVGQDGYWYNIVLGDVDAKFGMLDIEPTDREMRFMNVAMRRNAEARYNKPNLFEKYGQIIVNFIFLIIIIIAIIYLVGKIGDIAGQLKAGLSTYQQTAEANQNILAHLDNICGGGLTPAWTSFILSATSSSPLSW